MRSQMTVSPIEYRYGREETKAIFSEESRLLYMLKVEAAITRAEEEFGLVPRGGTAEMVERAAFREGLHWKRSRRWRRKQGTT